jgi:ParB family transcriptional regulator, chromosome partitioning protein
MNNATHQKLEQPKSRLDLVREMHAQGNLSSSLTPTGRKIVSIDKLVEDPNNERKTFDDMDDMISSVRVNGIIEPITVMPLEDGKFQIITGHRRYRAAKALNIETVEILIRETEDEWKRRKKSLVSNVQRKDIRPIELAYALQAILDNDPGIKNQDALADAIGKGKTWVSEMLRILTLPLELQQKIETAQQFISADAVSKIARLDDRSMQEQLIDELLSGASVRDIRTRINELTGKKKDPKARIISRPKKVFHTGHKVSVIVQSETSQMTRDQVVAGLEDALKQAKEAN